MRRTPARRGERTTVEDLPNDRVSPLFVAVAEATEEAILNSLLAATTTRSVVNGRAVEIEALDHAAVRAVIAGGRR